MKISKTRVGALLITTLWGSLLAHHAAVGQQALTKVAIGHSNFRNDVAALWVPVETGIFQKNGLDVAVTLVEGGRQMTQAILSGSIPIGMTGVTTVANSVVAGGDAILILGITNRVTFDIWAKPELKTAQDLKGKIFGVSDVGGVSHTAAFLLLKQFGLDPQRDRITFLAAGDEGVRAQALLSGRIDVTVIDPSVAGPVREKGFTFLGNMEKMGVPIINNAMVTTKKYIKEQPTIVEAFVRSVVEANAYILNPANRRRVTEILAKNLRLDADKAEAAYKDLLPKVERKPYLNMEAIAATLQILAERNPKITQLKPADLVDVSILRRLDQEGFVDQLYR